MTSGTVGKHKDKKDKKSHGKKLKKKKKVNKSVREEVRNISASLCNEHLLILVIQMVLYTMSKSKKVKLLS
jgi:hypothetical protein